MLIKLSRKAFSPFGVKELNQFKLIHKEPLFIMGLFIKICLVFYSFPLIHSELFIPFILIFTFANVSSTLVRLLGIWFFEKLSAAIGNDLSVKAFSSTLNREYDELLRIDSSKLIKNYQTNILEKVKTSSGVLLLLCIIIASAP